VLFRSWLSWSSYKQLT